MVTDKTITTESKTLSGNDEVMFDMYGINMSIIVCLKILRIFYDTGGQYVKI